ncbi:MAG TPA: EAL domain-containing protein [Gammaproteobacteria bacterium]
MLVKLRSLFVNYFSSLTPGLVINLSIILMSSFVLVLSLSAGWATYQEYRIAEQNKLVNVIANQAMVLAGKAAIERGVTSTALGSGKTQFEEASLSVSSIRAEVDASHADLSNLIKTLGTRTIVTNALDRVQSAYQELVNARGRIDQVFERKPIQISLGEWVQTVARYNMSLDQLHKVIFSEGPWRDDLIILNVTIRHLIWMASEYAGIERGILAYYISRKKPLPAELRGELKSYRNIVEHNLIELFMAIDLEQSDSSIKQSIAMVQKRFLEDYQEVRQRVYAAENTGDYPITGEEWLVESTHAINSLLDVAHTVTDTSANITEKISHSSYDKLIIHFVIILITFVLMLLSIFKVRQSANLLTREKELAEVTLHSIGDAVITTDANALVEYLNPIAEQYTGWLTAEAKGKSIREIFNIVQGFTREPAQSPIEQCLLEKRVVGLGNNTVLINRSGLEFHIEDSAAPIHDNDGNVVGAVMVFYDISTTETRSHLLAHYATHDVLTGLVNRREFERLLTEALTSAHREHEQHAFCYMDLDQFKVVNDTCGHVVGDKLLRHLTYLLGQHVRESDTLARLGGDEFGLLLKNCKLDRAYKIAEELRDVVHTFRFTWEDKTFEIGCSIGLVPITLETVSPAELLKEADAACYVAKDKGRNRVQIFEPGNIELARRHGEMQWVTRINQALDENRLLLYVQDIKPLIEGRKLHREVLVRLQERDSEIVPPGSFIPAAERYNLMPTVDRWVIDTTFKWLKENQSSELDCAVYNVNLSGNSVSDNDKLYDYIVKQCQFYNITPASICFEITETAAVHNLSNVAELIRALKAKGFSFALDDFGSGLSSFMYLKTLPVDFLKINGSFVRDMPKSKIDCTMVQSINSIGHVMGLKTIAEFVENDEIVELLQKIGVDYAQGYAVGRPVPLAQINTAEFKN